MGGPRWIVLGLLATPNFLTIPTNNIFYSIPPPRVIAVNVNVSPPNGLSFGGLNGQGPIPIRCTYS